MRETVEIENRIYNVKHPGELLFFQLGFGRDARPCVLKEAVYTMTIFRRDLYKDTRFAVTSTDLEKSSVRINYYRRAIHMPYVKGGRREGTVNTTAIRKMVQLHVSFGRPAPSIKIT